MRQVRFSPGPFLDQYEDGHPPEKHSEEERRRYRSGLPSKSDLETATVDASRFEEAFQQWIGRYEGQQNSTPHRNKENTLLMGPNDDVVEGESIPASDYSYHAYKASDKGRMNTKECFVIDISAVSACTDPTTTTTTRNIPSTRHVLLSCCGSRQETTESTTHHDNPFQSSSCTVPL